MDLIAAPASATHRPWFWVVFAVLAVTALVVALPLFPRAFPILDLHVSMNQAQALSRAQELSRDHGVGPPSALSAASFSEDDTLQTYVELEAGGVPAWRSLITGGAISPYTWTVRRFNPDQVHEASISFTPAGAPWGFSETIAESEPGPALSEQAARTLAEQTATRAPWRIDLAPYRELPPARVERPNKRVDYTFSFERTDLRIGEAPVRLSLGVVGDHITVISRTVAVPESFSRHYATLRAANELIANVDLMVVVVLVLVIGGIAIAMMARRRMLSWKPAVVVGMGIGALVVLAQLNELPLLWFQYDTAQSQASFHATCIIQAVSSGLALGVVMSITFLLAEGLSRMAFPDHPRLWTLWRAANAGSNAILGRVVAGYLLVFALLALQIIFYAVVNQHLGWWSPASALSDPNALASWQPWLTPCVEATQAGLWEESLFRAIPLAAAALLGRRLGYPRLTLAVAVVLQAVMFGAAHANYPNQPAYARLVEIAIPFTCIGLVYIRYGLVVGMVMHAAFDLALMSLPLFVSDAPGIIYQRALVILIGSIPLLVSLGARLRCRGSVRHVERNGDSQPAPPAARLATTPPQAELGPRVVIGIILLGGICLAALTWIGSRRSDAPALTLTSSQALVAARGVLVTQGVDASTWQGIMTSGPEEPGAVDRVAWTQARERFPGWLRDGWLWGPCYTARFVHWEGSEEAKAEEWSVTLDPQGQLVRLSHTLPEAATGAQLEMPAALAIGEATLAQRFPANAPRMHLKSSTPSTRPHRRDWSLDYSMRVTDPALGGLDQNIAITIAGDQVVDAYRYLFVPEALNRAHQRHQADLAIVHQAAALVLAVLLLALVVMAITGCFINRQSGSPWLVVGISCTLLELAHRALTLPAALVGYSTARPLESQLATTLIAGGVWALVLGGSMALMVLGFRLRPPVRPGYAVSAAGAMWGVVLVVLLAIAGAIAHDGALPQWRSFSDSDALMPRIAVMVHGLLGGIIVLVLVQSAVRALHSLGGHWQGGIRSGCAYALCVLLAAALAENLDPSAATTYLALLLSAAVMIIVSLRLVLRDARTLLPAATMIAVGGQLPTVLHPGFPGAAPAMLVAMGLTVAVAVWWGRRSPTLAAPRAA